MNRSLVTIGISAGFAALLLGASPGGARTTAHEGLQAWLRTAGTPQASAGRGVFVARLHGRTLIWSLASGPRGTRAAAAHLSVGRAGRSGSAAVKLCSPCSATVRGRSVLGAAQQAAVRAGRAFVDVHARTGVISGRVVSAAAPTIEILSPKAGETIDLPAQVSYSVTGLDVAERHAHLEVYVPGDDAHAIDVPLDGSGVVMLPDVKDAYLTGQHDLAFQLATADAVPLPNAEAKTVVRTLTIRGRRTGP
jgi:hypothetical protein